MTTTLLITTTVVLFGTTLWMSFRPITAALLVPSVWLVTTPVQSFVLAPRLGIEGTPKDDMYVAISIANVAFVGFQLVTAFGVIARLQQRVQRWATANDGGKAEESQAVRYWFVGLLVIAVGLALLHWALMPGIPLVQLFQGLDANQLQVARENSAKLLAAPTLLKYAFTWNSRILFPVLFTTAVLARWRWTALLVGVFGLIYAMSPLERLPAVLLVLGPFAAIAIRDGKRVWSPLVIGGVVVSLLPALAITEATNFAVRPAPAAVSNAPAQPTPTPSPSNRSPLSAGEFSGLPLPVAAALDLVLRRTGEGPTDVTYEWFVVFPVHHPYLNGSGWEPWHVLSPGYQTPANIVGLWAYYGKAGYDLTSITAYGSFIADGWAEFGMAGVVMATLLLLGLCLVLELMRGLGTRPFTLACYVTPVVLVAVVAPIGGLPAIVLSLGVWMTPLLSVGYVLTERRLGGVRGLRLVGRPTTP